MLHCICRVVVGSRGVSWDGGSILSTAQPTLPRGPPQRVLSGCLSREVPYLLSGWFCGDCSRASSDHSKICSQEFDVLND